MMQVLGAILRWTIFTIVLAVAAHAGALFVIPGVLMSRAMALASTGAGANAMTFPAPVGAATDQLIASCVFNLSQNELRLTVPRPITGTWSVTIYGEDARPFFFRETAKDDRATLDAVLIEPGAPAQAEPGATLIEAPSFTGLILVRASDAGAEDLAGNDRVRHQASCRAIPR